MSKNALIKITEKFVKERLADESTGHDWWHIERVRNNARLIQASEKADSFIVEMALLLHDVGDRKVIGKEHDDYSIAENFLKKNKILQKDIDQIMFIIQNMSFSKSFDTKATEAPIEFQIVQDADRLDAVGAIGIARAFAYGGQQRRLLYDPTQKLQKAGSAEKYRRSTSSTLHHFVEKIFLLKHLMNTKTARRIAEKRDRFSRQYFEQFLAGWEGKK